MKTAHVMIAYMGGFFGVDRTDLVKFGWDLVNNRGFLVSAELNLANHDMNLAKQRLFTSTGEKPCR